MRSYAIAHRQRPICVLVGFRLVTGTSCNQAPRSQPISFCAVISHMFYARGEAPSFWWRLLCLWMGETLSRLWTQQRRFAGTGWPASPSLAFQLENLGEEE